MRAGRRAARAPGRDRAGGGACRPACRRRRDSPTCDRRTSTVISSVIFTTKKSTWSGRRFTGCSWMPCRSTGRALPPPTLRSTRVLRPTCRRRSSKATRVQLDRLRGLAVAVDDAGQDALAAQGLTVLPTISRGSAVSADECSRGRPLKGCGSAASADGAESAERMARPPSAPDVPSARRWHPRSSSSKTSSPSRGASSTPSSRRATRSPSPAAARRRSSVAGELAPDLDRARRAAARHRRLRDPAPAARRPARRRPCSCSPLATRRWTRSSASSSAPTTT